MPESRKRVKRLSLLEKLRATMNALRKAWSRRRYKKEKTTVTGRSKFTSRSGREYRAIHYSSGGTTLVRRFPKPKGKANVKRQKRLRVREMLVTRSLVRR